MDTIISDTTAATHLTRALAERASAVTYDSLPEPVRELARQCVLDYYGVALAGADDPLATILLDELTEAEGAPPCPVGRAGQRRDRPRARLRRRQSGDAGPSLGRDPAGFDRARRRAPELRARGHRRLCRRIRDRLPHRY